MQRYHVDNPLPTLNITQVQWGQIGYKERRSITPMTPVYSYGRTVTQNMSVGRNQCTAPDCSRCWRARGGTLVLRLTRVHGLLIGHNTVSLRFSLKRRLNPKTQRSTQILRAKVTNKTQKCHARNTVVGFEVGNPLAYLKVEMQMERSQSPLPHQRSLAH